MLQNNIDLKGKTILVTGSAGFIGSNLVLRLLKTFSPINIVGLDSVNDYYDVRLKEYRLSEIDKCASEYPESNYTFVKGNLVDKDLIDSLFSMHHFDIVVNLAAQAGVRYSIENPGAYIESNLIGFYNILEACRHSYDVKLSITDNRRSSNIASDVAQAGSDNKAMRDNQSSITYQGVRHLVYASSSSVYGGNKKVPFAESDMVDNPVSLYAATKKSNELLAHSYSKLYGIPSTGLRFFTVYGPAGRPDMAYFGFTNKLIKGDKIQIFNYGNCKRDFTYVDDIVEGVVRVMQHAPEVSPMRGDLEGSMGDLEGSVPYKVYNIGNSNPENLLDFVQILQEELVRANVLPSDYDFESHKELVPMQAGDVPVTYADTSSLEADFGFKPHTSLREGLRVFAKWYKAFYYIKC